METLWQDVKYGLRMWKASRGVTFLALATLALGIGANTAIFSVVSTVLLRSLPYADPHSLVMVFEKRPRENRLTGSVSPADFLDWRSDSRSFTHVAAQESTLTDLIGAGEPERLATGRVSASFFDALGVRAARGRFFAPDEEQEGRENVVVVTDGLWRRRFGADPALVGKDLNLGGVPHRVIGILPESFRFPERELEIFIPLAVSTEFRETRALHYLSVFARLRPGVTLSQAQSDLDSLSARLESEHRENRGHAAHVVPLKEQFTRGARPALLVLSAAVGLVLLIACANVANLLLARSRSRGREISIRAALGAGGRRLVRQLLTESVLLAVAGGIAGLVFAGWGVDLLKVSVPSGFGIWRLEDVAIDRTVLVFTAVLVLLTGVLVGLLPALRASRVDLTEDLKEGGRTGSAGRARERARSALVVLEVALCLMLLAGAGLMIRTLIRLSAVDPGFRSENVLSFQLALPRARYPERRNQADFFRELLARLRTIAGVRAAGAISILPLSGGDARVGLEIEDRPASDEPTRAHIRAVTAGYFEAMTIPLLTGRLPVETDGAGSARVVLVNETAVRRYWPDQSPLGRRLRPAGSDEWRTIVGVVGDVKHWGLDGTVNPEMYIPVGQLDWPSMSVLVRASSNRETLVPAIREQVRALDKDQPLSAVRTLEDVVHASVSPRRFLMLLLGIFAATALILAGIGIAGVLSYAVTERTHEIGIRMAMGADPRRVQWLIMRDGMFLAALGLVGGLGGALGLTRALRTLLFDVTPSDPATFLSVAGLLMGVALLASYLPARRATRVDPVVALRAE